MQEPPIHALVISDIDGLICHWSDGAERLFGYTAAEAVGRTLDLIVPAAYRVHHWEGFRRAMSTGVCKVDGVATARWPRATVLKEQVHG